MTRRGILGAGVGTILATLSACNIFRSPSYRFRLTVNVDTPEGLKTGSSVCEVKADRGTDLLTGGGYQATKMRGEAAFVELLPGRYLFALLPTNDPLLPDISLKSLEALDGGFEYKRYDSTRRIAKSGRIGPVNLDEGGFPILVTFEDLADPASLEVVEPSTMPSMFGADYSLRSITVETTTDPVTDHVGKTLPWLATIRSTLKPSTTIYSSEKPLGERIRPRHFSLTEFGTGQLRI